MMLLSWKKMGGVEEQIYFEYVSLNLSSPPRVKQVTTNEEAFEELALKRYDLIITMPGVDCSETFTQAKAMKRLYPYIPIVVLTPFSSRSFKAYSKGRFKWGGLRVQLVG